MKETEQSECGKAILSGKVVCESVKQNQKFPGTGVSDPAWPCVSIQINC